MASVAKKKKAKNSFMMNGGARADTKLRRINYYKKRDRDRLNNIIRKMEEPSL
jgi:hypothetical protein